MRLELDHLAPTDSAIIPFELFFKPAKNMDPDKRIAALEAKVERAHEQLDISAAALADTGSAEFSAVVVAVCHQKVRHLHHPAVLPTRDRCMLLCLVDLSAHHVSAHMGHAGR